MWKVYKYAHKDIVAGEENDVICKAGEWFLIGDYDTIDAAASVMKHQIYLDNCVLSDEDPIPQYKIESSFE